MGLVAFAMTLSNAGSNALAQQVTGGMGEQVHIGAFDARTGSRLVERNPQERPPAKVQRARGKGTPETNTRYAKPTLPGKHLR